MKRVLLNRVLLDALIEMLEFLELTEDHLLDADTAFDEVDKLGAILQNLTPDEREEFIKYIEDRASREEQRKGGEQKAWWLRTLLETLGLVKPVHHYYFVRHLSPDDNERAEGEFEIQVLDRWGRGKYVGYAGLGIKQLKIEDHIVPELVLEAVQRQPEGFSDYINELGQRVNPLMLYAVREDQ